MKNTISSKSSYIDLTVNVLSKHTAYERMKFPQGDIKKGLETFCVAYYNAESSLYLYCIYFFIEMIGEILCRRANGTTVFLVPLDEMRALFSKVLFPGLYVYYSVNFIWTISSSRGHSIQIFFSFYKKEMFCLTSRASVFFSIEKKRICLIHFRNLFYFTFVILIVHMTYIIGYIEQNFLKRVLQILRWPSIVSSIRFCSGETRVNTFN